MGTGRVAEKASDSKAMEERQRQGRTQRAGQEKEVKGKEKNGRELESNIHNHAQTGMEGDDYLYQGESWQETRSKQHIKGLEGKSRMLKTSKREGQRETQ